jgi:hypothetical protein
MSPVSFPAPAPAPFTFTRTCTRRQPEQIPRTAATMNARTAPRVMLVTMFSRLPRTFGARFCLSVLTFFQGTTALQVFHLPSTNSSCPISLQIRLFRLPEILFRPGGLFTGSIASTPLFARIITFVCGFMTPRAQCRHRHVVAMGGGQWEAALQHHGISLENL